MNSSQKRQRNWESFFLKPLIHTRGRGEDIFSSVKNPKQSKKRHLNLGFKERHQILSSFSLSLRCEVHTFSLVENLPHSSRESEHTLLCGYIEYHHLLSNNGGADDECDVAVEQRRRFFRAVCRGQPTKKFEQKESQRREEESRDESGIFLGER